MANLEFFYFFHILPLAHLFASLVWQYTNLTTSSFLTDKDDDSDIKFEWRKLRSLACEEHGGFSKFFHHVLNQQVHEGNNGVPQRVKIIIFLTVLSVCPKHDLFYIFLCCGSFF